MWANENIAWIRCPRCGFERRFPASMDHQQAVRELLEDCPERDYEAEERAVVTEQRVRFMVERARFDALIDELIGSRDITSAAVTQLNAIMDEEAEVWPGAEEQEEWNALLTSDLHLVPPEALVATIKHLAARLLELTDAPQL